MDEAHGIATWAARDAWAMLRAAAALRCASARAGALRAPLTPRAGGASSLLCRIGGGSARVCTASAAADPAPATVAEKYAPMDFEVPTVFKPSYSRRDRRARLQAALDSAARGGEFVLPKPEPRTMPGPCGAVMIVLGLRGPLTTSELFDALNERFPGVVKSKTHLKQRILKRALVNKLLKVRVDGGKFKDRWAVRRKGQLRMGIARGTKKSTGPMTRRSPRGGLSKWRKNI